MIEQKRSSLLLPVRRDSNLLQQRARRQRQRHQEYAQSVQALRQNAALLLTSPSQSIRRLPSRFLLHLVIALVLPVAIILGALPVGQQQQDVSGTLNPAAADLPLGLGPVDLDVDSDSNDVPLVGDPPLGDDEAIPMPLSLTSRSEALAPLVVQAKVGGETARLRTGPGLDYDEVTKLEAGTALEVIGRAGDWFQVRSNNGQVNWMAGELLDISEAAVSTLFEVPAEMIPPPPPPKVATVREENLNLRDGPGTNYIGMVKLDSGMQLSLLEQYQDWMHVATNDNRSGWVKTEFLSMVDGVLPRIPVTENIPDPNPAMVGWVNENGVSLRKGPGSNYPKLGTIGDAQVQLVARYKDWFKVKTNNGTTAWIFSDFLQVAPMVDRRIATTNDIPALPQTIAQSPRSTKPASGQSPRAAAAAAPSIAASGDVASFAVKFVGYRYRWGGSSPAGFDCSGLTSYVYRQYGVGLPHSAAAQLSPAYGAVIGNMGNLAPGDLVFFVNTGRRGISHVAIYVGGGRIVHAMTPGLGVQVSNINSSYWVNHFYAGLRPYR